MAVSPPSPSISTIFFFFTTLFSSLVISQQQPALNSLEQESVYQVLNSINPTIPWRSLFPDDFCSSAPHGVVCDYLIEPTTTTGNDTVSVHISELNFGYVSDYTSNPPCTPNSTLNPLIFTSFKYLRKLFFYKCFTGTRVSFPETIPQTFGSSLEELVFIENPSLVGSINGFIGNFTRLRRLVLVGNGVYGNIPGKIGDLGNLEEITLSRNKLSGGVGFSFDKLKKLRVLDLSQNYFHGNLFEEMGTNLTDLLKLDLSYNGFYGKIPESFGFLHSLEFLDLSFNHFGNFGVPLFLANLPRLREVYLSGNKLGGQIPEIWENLGGILGIGFSEMGLVGNIPSSMGIHLKSLCYLRLDNNKLEGNVPEEFGVLEFISEINLENNSLSGKIPFSGKFEKKLKLKGNPDLCVGDKELSTGFEQLKLCQQPDFPSAVLFDAVSSTELLGMASSSHLVMIVSWVFVYLSLVIA